MAIEALADQGKASLSPGIAHVSKREAPQGAGTRQEMRNGGGVARGEVKREPEQEAPSKVDEQYIERVDKALDLSNVGREYKVYDKLGKVYIRLYDKQSGDLIREFPRQEIIELAKKMEKSAGLIFRETV